MAATFGWLCVETVLQLINPDINQEQPPSGGCVLKLLNTYYAPKMEEQPPSGGCVLKLAKLSIEIDQNQAATFGWLCVETMN